LPNPRPRRGSVRKWACWPGFWCGLAKPTLAESPPSGVKMARVGRMLWAVPCAHVCYSAPHRLFHASASRNMAGGYNLNLSGKVAFVAGVSDSTGYGWAVAKQLANAGATIIVGAWPPSMCVCVRMHAGKLEYACACIYM